MNNSELRRLRFGPEPGEKPGGIGTVRFKVTCKNECDDVLAKTKEVLEVVLSNCNKTPFPTDESWRRILPSWFVAQCAQERTEDEDKEFIRWWDSLSWEQKQLETKKEKRWPLSGWIYWFRPENRQWFWWDATIADSDTTWVAAVVDGWPFPWQSLEWLFKAAGAITVESED